MTGGAEATVYPLAAVRALALQSQLLADNSDATSTPDSDNIYSTIERIGCVQIDTLQLVQRSQYLALWSRLGDYDTSALDYLLSGGDASSSGQNNRRLFEYWLHAACLIPLSEYRYCMPAMSRFRNGHSRGREWLTRQENIELMQSVLERVRSAGPLRASDFESDTAHRSGWWDWKPAKRALEYLYDRGDLMIARRVKFQRVYDLRERVLPDWVQTAEASEAETMRHLMERSMLSLGICEPMQVADYTHTRRTEAKPTIEKLIEDGTFTTIQAELSDGKSRALALHRDNLPLLEQAADGALVPQRTTFLSPFDNLFWAKGRDMQFWNFNQTLEAYKPEADRIWGYFCLPILHKGRLVGRFDPKLERKTGTLRIKKLYLEPGVAPEQAMISDIADALRDFLKFHGASDLVIEESNPTEFGQKLTAML